MQSASSLASLTPLEKSPSQAYFSNAVQLADVMSWVLSQIGPESVVVSTFSTSEEFIRKVLRLKDKGEIKNCSLICDIRAARKTLSLYNFIKSVFDRVCLCENHSKVILFKGEKGDAVVITSQNQTRGNRYECGVISTERNIISYLEESLNELMIKSNALHELL